MARYFCVVIVVVCTLVACEEELPEHSKTLGSRVELAAGEVWLHENGAKKRLITGAMLPDQSSLEVDDGARALVRLCTGAGVFLRGAAKVEIDDGVTTLSRGELWADVPAGFGAEGSFSVGLVTVNGVDVGFDLLVDKGVVNVYVARGIAVVASPRGRVEVHSGERAIVKDEGAPVVEPVSFFEDWTGGMTDGLLAAGKRGRASGRIYGIDSSRPGKAPQELEVRFQEVRVTIRNGVAHTEVEQSFFNPGDATLEGWYWFTVPEGAVLDRFALDIDGRLVDGKIVERKQAAAAYTEAVERAMDPALLEWIDERTFRARIFPIHSVKERRVVLSYKEMLPLVDGVYRYMYPMGGTVETPIGEFSLKVELNDRRSGFEISTSQDARIERDGRLITMRRSGFVPHSDFLLELRPRKVGPRLEVLRYSMDSDTADYLMLRYSPDIEWSTLPKVPGDVVVVVDTSAGGDAADRQVRTGVVEAILRALSSDDHFAVVAADLTPRVVYPALGLAEANEKNVALASEKLAEIASAGASDLGAMFSTAFQLLHEAEQPAVVYVGDGRPTVGETDAIDLSSRLKRSLGDSKARLFTIAVGENADYGLLKGLARVGGGKSFRVDTSEQTVQEALRFVGLVKTPTITDFVIEVGAGMDQVFSTADRKISKGEEVILCARTHNALPKEIRIAGKLGRRPFEKHYKTEEKMGKAYSYIPQLWARQYLEHLMGDGALENRGRIISLGLEYGMMTPFTSFLVLENMKEGSVNEDDETGRSRAVQWLKKDRRSHDVRSGRSEYQGGRGKRHKGEEGQMGKRDSKTVRSHYGIRGANGNQSPRMARARMKNTSRKSGVLSYLSTANSPTAPFGNDSAGQVDPEDALSALRGNQIGEEFGYSGLSLKGTGRGGGSIGVGNTGVGGGIGTGVGSGDMGFVNGKRKNPRVGQTVVGVRGGLSKEVIRRIVQRHKNEVKFCYEKSLRRRRNLQGQITVRTLVSSGGSVENSLISGSSIKDLRLEKCIADVVKRITFPRPKDGGIGIFSLKFDLRCDGVKKSTSLKKKKSVEIATGEKTEEKKKKKKKKKDTGKRKTGNITLPAHRQAKSRHRRVFKLGVCSDASRRPLFERKVLWQRRLSMVEAASELSRIYFEAGQRCELPGLRDQRVLLNMVERWATGPESIGEMLNSFVKHPSVGEYLRRRIVRRSLRPSVTMGLHFPGSVDWPEVIRGLAALTKPGDRVKKLISIVEKHPDDSVGRALLVRAYFGSDMVQEALAEAQRLRRDGLASPAVLEILCDLQAENNRLETAKRTCSELVEFNADDPETRRKLGDLFLKHGWYAAAYRQYLTLVDKVGDEPVAMLRLAAAAAGMGKLDEAMRIERRVSAGDGEPGAGDPRQWARIHSAAKLARMLMEAQEEKDEAKIRVIERSLKKTQVLSARSNIVILVWEDFGEQLGLIPKIGKESYPVIERIVSKETGLVMLDLGEKIPEELQLYVGRKGGQLNRDVPYTLLTIGWDKKKFTIIENKDAC